MTVTLRVAALQLNPHLGSIAANVAAADHLITRLVMANQRVDVLVLPELAFTGYNFPSRSAIEPYLEPTPKTAAKEGISTEWARATSQRLGCHTLVGYPEFDASTNKIYNSAVFTSPQGDVLFNYRKRFLYQADEVWGASEGPDGSKGPSTFPSFGPFKSLANGKIKVQVGICMDLNPYKFEAPFENFEFANSLIKNDVSLVLCPMAWLHPESPNLNESEVPKQELSDALEKKLQDQGANPGLSTVNYWITRLMPLFVPLPSKTRAIIACNRWGIDDDAKGPVFYAGSSSIFNISPKLRSPHIDLKGTLGQTGNGTLVAEVEVDEL